MSGGRARRKRERCYEHMFRLAPPIHVPLMSNEDLARVRALPLAGSVIIHFGGLFERTYVENPDGSVTSTATPPLEIT